MVHSKKQIKFLFANKPKVTKELTAKTLSFKALPEASKNYKKKANELGRF